MGIGRDSTSTPEMAHIVPTSLPRPDNKTEIFQCDLAYEETNGKYKRTEQTIGRWQIQY